MNSDNDYKKSLNMVHDAGYDSLANAVIMQALSDYKIAALRIVRNDFNIHEYSQMACKKYVREVPRFLKSDYFETLTKLNGQYLLDVTNNILDKEYGVSKDELLV